MDVVSVTSPTQVSEECCLFHLTVHLKVDKGAECPPGLSDTWLLKQANGNTQISSFKVGACSFVVLNFNK